MENASGPTVQSNVACDGPMVQRRVRHIRDLTILGRQRDGQNKFLQINGSKDSSWNIINRMNLIQFLKLKTLVLWLGRVLLNPV